MVRPTWRTILSSEQPTSSQAVSLTRYHQGGAMSDLFEARRTETERISAQEYLSRRAKNPRSVRNARIVPPSLDDDDDYGSFIIERRAPLYEVDL